MSNEGEFRRIRRFRAGDSTSHWHCWGGLHAFGGSRVNEFGCMIFVERWSEFKAVE